MAGLRGRKGWEGVARDGEGWHGVARDGKGWQRVATGNNTGQFPRTDFGPGQRIVSSNNIARTAEAMFVFWVKK